MTSASGRGPIAYAHHASRLDTLRRQDLAMLALPGPLVQLQLRRPA